jgi:hypothetical protein
VVGGGNQGKIAVTRNIRLQRRTRETGQQQALLFVGRQFNQTAGSKPRNDEKTS